MKIHGVHHRAIESDPDSRTVRIIDQTFLPHAVVWQALTSLDAAAEAIRVMRVRGAPLIGATAAFGYFLALRSDATDTGLKHAYDTLYETRPTAVNLRWALDRVRRRVASLPVDRRVEAAWEEASAIAEHDVATNAAIGRHGLAVLQALRDRKTSPGDSLHVMTHCNAGWLACVDWGTALSPIYHAHDSGIPVHVWVSETRPRGQGASLTAWELAEHGVPHTLVVDNEAGHLVQRGLVDACIVGADRVSARGDVANKIGTYLKALACAAHGIPFYAAVPGSTMDWRIADGIRDIPIEQRSGHEVTHVGGIDPTGRRTEVLVAPAATTARNDAFDVTPAAQVTGLITEHGVFAPLPEELRRLAALLSEDGSTS